MTNEEAERFGTERVALDGLEIDPDAIAAVPAAFARAYHFMPISLFDGALTNAIPEADDDYVENLVLGPNRELHLVGAYRDEIDWCIERYYRMPLAWWTG